MSSFEGVNPTQQQTNEVIPAEVYEISVPDITWPHALHEAAMLHVGIISGASTTPVMDKEIMEQFLNIVAVASAEGRVGPTSTNVYESFLRQLRDEDSQTQERRFRFRRKK
jgi:hypothetical protein